MSNLILKCSESNGTYSSFCPQYKVTQRVGHVLLYISFVYECFKPDIILGNLGKMYWLSFSMFLFLTSIIPQYENFGSYLALYK